MPIKLVRCAVLVVCSLVSTTLHAQSIQSSQKTHPPISYAAEPFVVEHWSRTEAMNADGTGMETQTLAIKIQSEAALRQFGVVTLRYASSSSAVEFVYVRVRHAGGDVTETPLSGVQQQPEEVTREAPFYSDLKQAQLPVKNLQVGDTLEWQSRVTINKPEAPGEFWGRQSFTTEGVILDDELEFSYPVSKAVIVWTNPKLNLQPQQTTEGDRRVYRWHHSSLKPTVGAEAQAEKDRKERTLLTPEEEQDLKEGALPSIAWTTFPDWAAVGAWYRDLQASRINPDPSITAKVAQLTAGKTTQEDKARAVYSFVSMQIRYIGVAFGVGRYQPHTAASVLDNGYGDCKDKHTLLAAMLGVLGLRADAVLIGAGVRFNPAVPSPDSFNHLITRTVVDGKEVWLDSTAEVAPYRQLMPTLRDKPALAIPPVGVAAIERTPSALPFPSSDKTVITGVVDRDFTSDSDFTMTFHSDSELVLRAVLRSLSVGQYDEFMQRFMAGLGYGGTVSKTALGFAGDPSQPLTLSFHYHRVKNENWGKNRITAMFTPIVLPWVDDKKPPIAALQLGTPRTETSTMDFQLPPGWKVDLPKPTHAQSPYAVCDVAYGFSGGTLHAERKLIVLKETVPAAEWSQYKAWYDEAGASGVPFIQLKPKK